ncbi:MAG: hypothetical protein AVDCRST_MAG89-1250 [uncultured Gemmatimonadetes bacterium]|uniref:Uncharacterized protein n=1 Tax=uncultured Gemmatimonadota bacterium TaxID=203437 RepID=A0A6J4KQV7_9BACT|nr:MAG: hypothetical protein AVDCRST_MAG89-1250 [uncultured Gemmatimonadota bacterium]
MVEKKVDETAEDPGARLRLALAACDRGSTSVEDVRPGEFEGDVSGDVSASLRGDAYSGSSIGDYHDVIVLNDPSEGAEVVFYYTDDEFAREGSLSIRNNIDLEYANGVVAQIEVDGRFFVATSGTMNLRDVTVDNVDGTARFRAVELDQFDDPISGSEVIVDVAFRADYAGAINFNLSPAFSAASAKASR